MKYCMNCGTLLEDSHEICIGCGADVTEEGSWSLYPPEMTKSIEIEQEEKKSRGGLIAAMIVVFILLVGAIAFFVVFNISRMEEDGMIAEEYTEEEYSEEEYVEEEPEEYVEAPEEVPVEEQAPVADNRDVKDASGLYYNYGSVTDMAGNVVFTTIYPEDFVEKVADVNYEIYSTKYPESVTYIVGNEDGNVQMTYMSPQHYWYRKSDRGKTRDNERDIFNYMQFLTYKGAQGYIEALIKQSYTDIKGFKFIDKEEFAPNITAKISEVSSDHTMELTGDIGDYANVASDTVYAAMEAEVEACIYHYEATSRQGNTIYMDFYVPVIANKLGYVTDMDSDKGEITEWIIPQFVAFEAGNEELYNYYKSAYKLFIANSKPTEEFMYLNRAYSKEIESAVSQGREPELLSADKLSSLHGGYAQGADLGRFGNGVYSFINTVSETGSYFDGDKVIVGENNSKVAFFSPEKNKVFISPAEDEYPGGDFTDLTYHEPSVIVPAESAESSESSEAGVS